MRGTSRDRSRAVRLRMRYTWNMLTCYMGIVYVLTPVPAVVPYFATCGGVASGA